MLKRRNDLYIIYNYQFIITDHKRKFLNLFSRKSSVHTAMPVTRPYQWDIIYNEIEDAYNKNSAYANAFTLFIELSGWLMGIPILKTFTEFNDFKKYLSENNLINHQADQKPSALPHW